MTGIDRHTGHMPPLSRAAVADQPPSGVPGVSADRTQFVVALKGPVAAQRRRGGEMTGRRRKCGSCGAAPPADHRLSCPRRIRCRCGAPAIRGGDLCAPCLRRKAVQRILDCIEGK